MIQDRLAHMLTLARAAVERAYAPYSHFHVGVCIYTTGQNFYTGCNIENASYSLVNCAEDTAISHMVNAGERDIAEILVTSNGDEICTPCGACRQRIREFATEDVIVHMVNAKEDRISRQLSELLPLSFGPDHLKKPQ